MFHPHTPVPEHKDEGALHEKLKPKLVPATIVEVTLGPGGIWGQCYGVVPLCAFTSERRASRAFIRRTCDVIFPDTVSFPLKQRLMIHGAASDRSLPEPQVNVDADSWEMTEDNQPVDDIDAAYDGMWKDNAANFEASAPLECVLALEPDDQEEVEPPIVPPADEEQPAVPPAEQEVKEDDNDINDEVAIIEGGKAPPGWRIDRFKCLDKVRLVSAPPWSRRPPTCEPEVWVSVGRAHQKELRDEWKNKDPSGFQAQEERRATWLTAKKRGVVPVAVAKVNNGKNAINDAYFFSNLYCAPNCSSVTSLAVPQQKLALPEWVHQVRQMIISGD